MTRSSAKLVTAAALLALAGCASETTAEPRGDGDDNSSPMAGGTPNMGGSSPGGSSPDGTVRQPAPGGNDTGEMTSGQSGMMGAAGSGGGGETGGGNVDCSQLPLPESSDDIISTFEDGTGATQQVAGRGGGFYMFNDETSMDQDPPPGALPPARMMERCGGQYALCMSGSGFTEWGAGMGTDLGLVMDGDKQSVDLSAYSGIAFWARTVSGTPLVRVSLKDSNTAPEGGVCDADVTSGEGACNDDWGKQISLTPDWKPHTLTFSELRQAGWGATYDAFEQSAVYSIQWQVGPNLDFDLCIDDLMLVR